MQPVVEAIVARLRATAAVTALVGDQIAAERLDQRAVRPWVEISIDDSDEVTTFAGSTNFGSVAISIRCRSGEYRLSHRVAGLVRSALHLQSWAAAGVTIDRVFIPQPAGTDESEELLEGRDEAVHTAILAATVWYRTA